MTVSEYEFFGVPGNQEQFYALVKQRRAIIEHEQGDRPLDSLGRIMLMCSAVHEYDKSGDREQLVIAAAWLVQEWEAVSK